MCKPATVDAGITFLNTADVYDEPRPGATGPAGTNEEMLAPFLHRRRDDIQLATKVGITADRNGPHGTAKRNFENLDALDVALDAADMDRLAEVGGLTPGTRSLSGDPTWISSGRE